MAEYVAEEVVLSSSKDERSGFTTEIIGLGERRERVVRCRACRYGDPFCDGSSYPGKIDCLHFAQWNYYDDEPGVCVMEPDDFCSYGVMRDGD